MKISVIGAGYVGLTTGACLAKMGHKVVIVDTNEERIEAIKQGKCPIHERGLEEILSTASIEVTNDLCHAITNTNISFVCVGTDSSNYKDCSNLTNVKEVITGIARILNNYHLIVIKSSVPPGTTENVIIPLLEEQGGEAGKDFGICVNPEFLREGMAISDFLNPDRIVIGEIDKNSGNILVELFKNFNCPIIRVAPRTAEMIKYASNAFLGMKISFINEIGNICKLLGIDTYEVAAGMGYDKRIGDKFLNAGIGFGGSCLPRNLVELILMSKKIGYIPRILEEVINLNEKQPLLMLRLLKKHVPNINGKEIGILGLAFKANTDDIRESRALLIVDNLLREGAKIKAYDPAAMDNFKKLFPNISYTSSKGVLKCEIILILTDWEEFDLLDYRGKIVIDGRRILKAKEAHIYEGICW
ncbi:UDP-glucose dehydrogenase family protein [Chloroflexota bacterium]